MANVATATLCFVLLLVLILFSMVGAGWESLGGLMSVRFVWGCHQRHPTPTLIKLKLS
jgi:hypothetical protein